MAHSESRNGRPCWSKYEGVGLTAVNDTCMLKSCIFLLLQRHFRNHPEYVAFVELFHEAAFRTELARLCEKATAASGQEDTTAERYDSIARNRTAFGGFYLPVALAIRYCGLASEEGLEQAKAVLLDIGVYSHIRDDCLDSFGNLTVTGKGGTGIKGNKCTWGVVQALGLSESYGKRVKRGRDALYADFEKRRRGELQAQIDAFEEDNGAIRDVLRSVLEGTGQ